MSTSRVIIHESTKIGGKTVIEYVIPTGGASQAFDWRYTAELKKYISQLCRSQYEKMYFCK